jgi:hypothetical protein
MVKGFWASAGFLLLTGTALSCAPADTEEKPPVPPELEFEDLTFRVYRGPKLEAEGSARRATYRRDTQDVAAWEVRALLHGVGQAREVNVAAARGQGNLKERAFRAEGGVRLEKQEEVAETAEAHWSEADGAIRGDEPVVVRGRDYTLRGPGFTMDPRTAEIAITGGVRGSASEEGR